MDNNLTFWGNGTQNDIKLSMEDYYDLVDTVHDEKLSREAHMKFKNLYEVNFYGKLSIIKGCLWVPFYYLPLGLGAALLATGKSRRSHSGMR
jgi:hypothetical protein